MLSEECCINITLGFRVNNTKNEIYKWAPSITNETVQWEGVPHKVRPPILRYLEHLMAHPSRAHKARGDYFRLVQPDLAQYQSVPLNGWERAQLVNFVLLPRWLHRLILLPSDKTLHQIDTLVADFVRAPKGMEATLNHHLLGTPPKKGGMGVGHLYRAYRRKYMTSMQQAMRAHPELFPFPLDAPVSRTQTPILTYVALLQSMGAMPGVSLQPVWRRPGGPNLYDSEDIEDGRLLAAQQPTVGQLDVARKYHSYSPATTVPDYGDVPEGYTKTQVSGLEVYTQGLPPSDGEWHRDGSKLVVQPVYADSHGGPRAGMAITCGRFCLIARVHGPQTSFRAELMGLCVAAELAPLESTITLDDKAVVDYGPQNPHREASDIDLWEMAARAIQRKSITVRWIPGHCQPSDARNAQQCTDIMRNDEVDRLAKLASTLPLLLYTPTFPSSISLGGTEAPTLAKKWTAALRPYPTHPGVHWVTWLPLWARRCHVWL